MQPAIDRFLACLASHEQRPALIDESCRLNYAELLEQVQCRVATLARLDARRVALALDNGVDWVLWDLALLASARVCVPLPGFFSPAQQRHVLDDAGVDTLISDSSALAPHLDLTFAQSEPGIWQRTPVQAQALPADTLKITYTSGTTGRPKGVCLDAATQLAVAESLQQVTAELAIQRHLCVLPLATLLENLAGVYAPLLAGAQVQLRSLSALGLQGASGFDVRQLLSALHEVRPNSLILLPQLLMALVGAAEAGLPRVESLRFIAVGGARVAPQLLRRADALELPVYEGYGLSECASVVCLNTPAARMIGSVGQPLGHCRVRLAEDGEVLVAGPRMLGYLGEAAPTGEWLGTGDLGHFEDGFLVLHGRKKHQFVTAYGRNVNPEWVEAELTQRPEIAQAWLYGEALPHNLAWLVPRHAGCSAEQLQAAVDAVNHGLPDYARIHRWQLASQPFSAANGLATANGRLRRAALFEHYRADLEAEARNALAETPT